MNDTKNEPVIEFAKNFINDTPSKVSVQSYDDFYTFDSVKMNDKGI